MNTQRQPDGSNPSEDGPPAPATRLRGGLCLFGGAFNPPHRTHRRLAERVATALAVDAVVVLPSGDHPHKTAAGLAPAAHRLAMCQAAFAGLDRLRVDDREMRRDGPCYSIDTVREFRAELGPEPPLYWLIGSDNLPTLPRWHDHHALLAEAIFVTFPRAGHPVHPLMFDGADLTPVERCHLLDHLLDDAPDEVSATAIRTALRDGADQVPGMLTDVAEYIATHALYR